MQAKTFDKQTAKFLAVVGENMPDLSGDVMQGWIQNPKAVQKALVNAFCPPKTTASRFNIWKTIRLGTLKTTDDFRKSLKDTGIHVDDWADDILGKPAFTAVTEETEVSLVKVTVAELGFKKDVCFDQLYDRAKKLGLDLCPPEVGFQLRLQYRDQPSGEWIFIGMEPITGPYGFLTVFCLRQVVFDLWLCGYYGDANPWDPVQEWVFCLPRK